MYEIPLSRFGLQTVAEAAEEKGVKVRTVQKWIEKGLLPVIVVGTGRNAKFLLARRDVQKFNPRPAGRPIK